MRQFKLLLIFFIVLLFNLSCFECDESAFTVDFTNKKVFFNLYGFFPPNESIIPEEDSLLLDEYSYDDIRVYNYSAIIYYYVKYKFSELSPTLEAKISEKVKCNPLKYKFYKSENKLNLNVEFKLEYDSINDTIKKYVIDAFISGITVDSSNILLLRDSLSNSESTIVETNGAIVNDSIKTFIKWSKDNNTYIIRMRNNKSNKELIKRTADCFKANGELDNGVVPKEIRKRYLDELK